MAIWQCSITIQDAKANLATTKIFIDAPDNFTAGDVTDPVQFLRELAGLLDDFIDGQIVHLGASVQVSLPSGLKAAPLPIADIEQGAQIHWRTVNGVPLLNTFPTWSEAFILVTGDVDITYDVARFIEWFTAPEETSANWSVQPCSSRGEAIEYYEAFQEKFKESRRG